MLKIVLAACAVLCALVVNADARPRHRLAAATRPVCVESVMRPCYGATSPADMREAQRVARGRYIADQLGIGGVADKPTRHGRRGRSSEAPAGIIAPLAAKVAELQSACGSAVISGVRHSYVKHTRRLSLHASGKAVDMRGNPGCLYAHLAGWPGGYSVDYGRVRHVHISWDQDGGREWGVHFRHGSHRHARRHHHRYASAQK
jgi:hypothetical protein